MSNDSNAAPIAAPTFYSAPLLPYMILLPIRLKKAMDFPPMNDKHSTSPVCLKALLPSQATGLAPF
jgi:hypothetical protein